MKRFNWKKLEASIVDLEKRAGIVVAEEEEEKDEGEGDEEEEKEAKKASRRARYLFADEEGEKDEEKDEEKADDEKEEKEAKKAAYIRDRVATTLENLADISDCIKRRATRQKFNGLLKHVANVYEACDRSNVSGKRLVAHLDAVDAAVGKVFPRVR